MLQLLKVLGRFFSKYVGSQEILATASYQVDIGKAVNRDFRWRLFDTEKTKLLKRSSQIT